MYKKRGVPKVYNRFLKNKLLIAATTLVGTIVGAGILGIPYVVAKVGILYGFILIVGLGLAFLLLNLFAGEVVLRTKKQHQLTGYAGKYLGPWGKRLMFITLLISIYGALTAYLIGEGATLYAIFQVGSPLLYTLLFFVVTFAIVYKGIKATGRAELILISLLVLVVGIIGLLSFNYINTENFFTFNLANIFIPYGVVLFAFMGLPAVPELQEELGKEKRKLKKAIVIGSIIPIVLYLFFTFIVMGVVGLGDFEVLEPNQRIATVALSMYAHPILGTFANILAVLAMFTSFLTLSIALIEIYEYDYGLSKPLAFGLTFAVPLLVTLLNISTFIAVLAITGAVAGGMESILMILTYWKAKKLGDRKPEYSLPKYTALGIVLICLFVIGMVKQILETIV